MSNDIAGYNNALSQEDHKICDLLEQLINKNFPSAQSKIWHGSPVWFIEGNPIVGYHKLKGGVRLLFWSGQSFNEAGLEPEGKYKAAGVMYTDVTEIKEQDVKRWLKKSSEIQWDYKNIVKRKGELLRLTMFN